MRTMILYVILILIINSFAIFAKNNYELQLLHVIFRHGIRTPADTYPNDPYISECFFPVGWGHLTNPGKLQMFHTGQYIREKYNNFLGDYYSDKISYARATDADRTISSTELISAGVWPPVKEQIWGPLNWQPVPVRSDPLNEDNLLLVRKPCAQYHIELSEIMSKGEVAEKLKDNYELFQKLSSITGLTIENFDDVQSLYSTLRAEEMYGLELPKWTKEYYPDILLPLTDYSYVINAFNDKLKRLKGGVLLKKLLIDWHQIANVTTENPSELLQLLKSEDWIKEACEYGGITNERRLFLYGGHDSTITNLLGALGVWETQNPDYGITVILELLKNPATQEFGIKIFLRNQTDVEPYLLTVPGCDSFCPLTKLTALVDRVIPRNWTEECYDPDFIPPEEGGP